jgi:DNA polymerase-3 subunit epsilon
VPLIVYNSAYDVTLLDRELRRHCDEAWMPHHLPIVDPLVLDRALDPYRRTKHLGGRTLATVSAHYGVPISEADAHGSTADALCAARVAWKIAKWWPTECGDLDTVQTFQAKSHRAWADHLGGYLVSQGKSDDVNRHWPYSPWMES